jgi:hypothetical protein
MYLFQRYPYINYMCIVQCTLPDTFQYVLHCVEYVPVFFCKL